MSNSKKISVAESKFFAIAKKSIASNTRMANAMEKITEKIEKRGGARTGAGKKSKFSTPKTKTSITIPADHAAAIIAYHKADNLSNALELYGNKLLKKKKL